MLTGAVGFNYNQGLTCWGCRKRRFQHQLHSLSNIIVWLEGRSWQPFMKSTSSNPLTFQELMLRLQSFWAERGCVLQQPYDVEVGAGTMTPETFLRVLGPRPYKVAYVQPSRRPADGRYGENPNRLFKHLQLQVILKPPPDKVQELYLESLGAIGIDLRQHDIKFDEDNWEAPTLSA